MDAAKSQKPALNQNMMLIIAIIVVVAVAVAVVMIVMLNNNTPTAQVGAYDGIPHTRTSDGAFLLGDPEAPITIVEFADFACPHCQDYHATMSQFVDEFVKTGKAKFEYRMFISAADPTYGPYTAQLAECAAEQKDGGFWPAHSILFELGSRGRFSQTTARTLADRMGLNYTELLECAGDANQWQKDVEFGSRLGIQSTPSIMVRLGDAPPQFITVQGQTFNRGPVPYELLKAVVESNQG